MVLSGFEQSKREVFMVLLCESKAKGVTVMSTINCWLDGKAKLSVVRMNDLAQFPALVGQSAIVSNRIVRECLLTSTSTVRLVRRLEKVRGSQEYFTKDLSGVYESQLETLDGQGVVRLGTQVSKGDILVGVMRKVAFEELDAEEKLLWSIFGRATDGAEEKEFCLRFDLVDPGIVTHVERRWSSEVEVEVTVRRELRVGDTLCLPDGKKLTVAAIVSEKEMNFSFRDTQVDILVGPDADVELRGTAFLRHCPKKCWKNWFKTNGEVLKVSKETRQVEEKLEARDVSGYSLVTQQPMGSGLNPAQAVTREMVQSLIEGGYLENVRELLTIKSDAVEGRTKAYEAMVKGEPVPLGNPWSTSYLEFVLRALGFALEIDGGSLKVKPLVDGRGQFSHGQVKSCDTVNYQTFRPVAGGLFCERVFGPQRNWQCSCGKHSGTKFQGIICDKCNVKVTHSRVRRERFGHISFPKPVVHPWFFPRIAEVLGESIDSLRKLINESGGEVVKERLESLSFPTAGLIMDSILVLPPDLRPLVFDEESAQFYTSDLNDLYRRVINRANRFWMLSDLNAPPVILSNEYRMLQQSVEALFDNLACPRPVLGTSNRPLSSLKEQLKSAVKLIGNKRSDYSAKGIVVPDPSVAEGCVGLPLKVAISLFSPFLVRGLKSASLADTIKAARKMLRRYDPAIMPVVQQVVTGQWLLVVTEDNKHHSLQVQIVDGEVLRINPVDALKFGLSFGPSRLRLFTPLSDRAKAECANPQPVSDTSSNLDIDHLLDACVSGNTVSLTPVDLTLLGR